MTEEEAKEKVEMDYNRMELQWGIEFTAIKKLDYQCAENIMRWSLVPEDVTDKWNIARGTHIWKDNYGLYREFNPKSDFKDSKILIIQMGILGYNFRMDHINVPGVFQDKAFHCSFSKNGEIIQSSKTNDKHSLLTSICMSSLEAIKS